MVRHSDWIVNQQQVVGSLFELRGRKSLCSRQREGWQRVHCGTGGRGVEFLRGVVTSEVYDRQREVMTGREVPVIDLGDGSTKPIRGERLYHALTETGFVRLRRP